jgi:hypothetical protein
MSALLLDVHRYSDVLAIIAISVIVAGIVISEVTYYGKDGMRDMWTAIKNWLKGSGKNGRNGSGKHSKNAH